MIKVKRTGLHMIDLTQGAKLKVVIVGPNDVGKTRWSTYWPKPIIANCEDGLLSVMDREVDYVDIGGAKPGDAMLDFLKLMRLEGSRPRGQWKWETVVIDTVDAYQRKLKQQWVEENKAASFGSYDAWDFLEQHMQTLFTRLLNLPQNVIVIVHLKDKMTTEGSGEGRIEKVKHDFQLQGAVRDWIANDFDLVGRMGTRWEAGENGRELRRGLTFKPDPEWPILKDRLNLTPPWLDVTFSEQDYFGLFSLLTDHLERLQEQGVEERPETEDIEIPADEPSPNVVTDVEGGPLPETVPKGVPWDQINRSQLMAIARGVPDLAPSVKGNTLKGELVAMLTKHRDSHPESWSEDGHYIGRGTLEAAAAEEKAAEEAQSTTSEPSTDAEEQRTTDPELSRSTDVSEPDSDQEESTPEEPAGEAEAPQSGDVASDESAADEAEDGTQADIDRSVDGACKVEGCMPDLPGTPDSHRKLSIIKFRRVLCSTNDGCYEDCFAQAKGNGSGPAAVPEGRGWDPHYSQSA